ncbi:amidohydrolase family protein [Pseudonocardia benzenivorans]
METSASDHTTYSSAQKLGAYESFVDIPPGFASVQTGLGLLYGRGVAAGRMTLEQFVAITSANAAKLFGLWPRKGRIAPGADADLVLIDPDRTTTLADEPLQSDYDPFVGIEVRGWPSVTVSRGDVVYRDGTITSTPGRGRWLHRRLGDPGTDPAIPSFSPDGRPGAGRVLTRRAPGRRVGPQPVGHAFDDRRLSALAQPASATIAGP